MDKIEVSGRTTEEAIQIAAMELGVSTDAVEYEIMEEGTKGFLGLGQSPTLIQAWISENYKGPTQPKPAQVVEDWPEEAEEELIPEPIQTKQTSARNEADEFADTILKMLEEILGAMNVIAKPVVKSVEGDEITVEMQGADVAIMIGRNGETLDALQYLLSIVANRSYATRWRLILDAGGYRKRYREILERKAREYADAVKAEGQEAELEPQPARDRRIIHVTLADDPDVYTYSEGEGDNRHVVISPKK